MAIVVKTPDFVSASQHKLQQDKQQCQGTLDFRKVHTYYPQFGERIAKPESSAWTVAAKKVGKIEFFRRYAPAFTVAVFFVASFISMLDFAGRLYSGLLQNRLLSVLPKAGQHAVYEDKSLYKVGKYYNADLRLTCSSDEGFQWKKKLIESAQESIELSCNFAGGSSFREILALLERRLQDVPTLRAHIILSPDLLERHDMAVIKRIQAKFALRCKFLISDRLWTLTPRLHTEENHVKMLVVDGKYFVAGGTSIHPRMCQETYDPTNDKEEPNAMAKALDPAWRDQDVVGKSEEIAGTMRKQFYNLFRIHEIRMTNCFVDNRYFALEGKAGNCEGFDAETGLTRNVRLKLLVSGPEHGNGNPIMHEYAKRIRKAKDTVRLAHWMFNPSKVIRSALQEAKGHKKLIAYLNGRMQSSPAGHSLVTFQNRGSYDLMDRVYEYAVPHSNYHKKVGVFDDTHMIVGSYNFATKSDKYDHEIALVIKDKRIATRAKEVLKVDGKNSQKFGPQEIKKGRIWKKILSSFITKITQNIL